MTKSMKSKNLHTLAALALSLCAVSAAAETVVPIHKVDQNGLGERIGEVTITESEFGLVFTPSLKGLSAGLHGFHVHQNASCEPSESGGTVTPAGAAGGHYDPDNAGAHGTPWGDGHLGDLPALYVDSDGAATHPVLAPRLKRSDLNGRALMIHAGGDNYSDQPQPLGGGGGRIACGVIDG